MYLEEAPGHCGASLSLLSHGFSLKYIANIIDKSTVIAKYALENQNWIYWLHACTQNRKQTKNETRVCYQFFADFF